MRRTTIELIVPKERIMELISDEANRLLKGDWHIHQFDVNAITDIRLQINPDNRLDSWVPLNNLKDEDNEDN
jgi:hypothetical protein